MFPQHSKREFAQVLLDNSPDALIAITGDGSILLWNRGAETLFGYTESDLPS